MLTYVEISGEEVGICVSRDKYMLNILVKDYSIYININVFKKYSNQFNITCLL